MRHLVLRSAAAILLLHAARPLPPAAAQQSLADALTQADRTAYGNRVAAANAREARANALAPLRGVLPNLRVEAGYVRTTDPIGAFGATMRQRTISQADFAPDRLNYPSAVGNYQGGVVIEQPLFNADAWAGRQAARRAAHASEAQADWIRLATRGDVVRAWYGAILADERVLTLVDASRAAEAHVAQAESMLRQGLVTKSDALLAAVRAGELEAQLADARGGSANARRQLVALLGQPGAGTAVAPGSRSLPDAARIRAVVASDTAETAGRSRADLIAAEYGADAARADARRARGVYLPRLNAFARYDWNSPDALYAGDENWTVGVMATWSIFAGAGDLAEVRGAASREQAARARLDAARASASLEVEETRTALIVALARLEIAERAVRQSAEAHRIVERKYAGGLATVVELLDAQAAETGSALALSAARFDAIAAAADRRTALGMDPGALAALERDGSVAAHPAPDDAGRRTPSATRDFED